MRRLPAFAAALILIGAQPYATDAPPVPEWETWISTLRSPDALLRLSAGHSFPAFAADHRIAIDALIPHLRDADPFVRRSVASALGEFRAEAAAAVPMLMGALRDASRDVREHALLALAKIGTPAIPALIDALKEDSIVVDEGPVERHRGDVRLSHYAVFALARIGPAAVEALIDPRRDRRVARPAELAQALDSFGCDRDRGRRRLRHDMGDDALAVVVAQAGADVVPLALKYLRDRDSSLRRAMLQGLAESDVIGAEAVPVMRHVIADAERSDAELAVRALVRVGEPAAPVLFDVLRRHRDWNVRLDAVEALQCVIPRDFEPLLEALSDRHRRVREAAAATLATVLIAHARRGYPLQRRAVVRGARHLITRLGEGGGDGFDRAADALRTLLSSPTAPRRMLAPDLIRAFRTGPEAGREELARLLGLLGPDAGAASTLLIDAMRDRSAPPALRERAASALADVGGDRRAVVDALIEILVSEPTSAVAAEAASSLGRLGQAAERAVPHLVARLRTAAGKASAEALASIDPAGVSALVDLLNSPAETSRTRRLACDAIRESVTPLARAVEILALRLADTDASVQVCAAFALAGTKRDVDEVTRILVVELGRAGGAFTPIVGALTRQGSEGIAALVRVVNRPGQDRRSDLERDVRIAAARALGQMRDPDDAAIRGLAAMALDAAERRQPQTDSRNARDDPTMVALESLTRFGSAAAVVAADFEILVRHPDPVIRVAAIEAIVAAEPDSPRTLTVLRHGITDPDWRVRSAAVRAALKSAGEAMAWKALATVAIDLYREETLSNAWDEITDALPPAGTGNRGQLLDRMAQQQEVAASSQLPALPWPPPRYTHIGEFGRDFPREAIGTDRTTLGQIHSRLFAALTAVDPNFETGLFGVPGGFALLAKLERVEADGSPLPAPYRWVTGKVPPLSPGDYIGRLFFEKPGYFRVIAFVITDQTNFRWSDAPLPQLSEGGTNLPADLAVQRFVDRRCYVLIYSFERVAGGAARPLYQSPLSATTHLQQSGMLAALQRK